MQKKLYNIRNDIINAFENKIFFRQSDIDNITKDFSGQTGMCKLKDQEFKKKFKQKKYLYVRWTIPIQKSDFKSIYNYVAEFVNSNKVLRINNNEVITAVPLSHFLGDINNNKFNTRDDAIKHFFRKNLS